MMLPDLWSLRDMLELRAAGLIKATAHLERIAVVFDEWADRSKKPTWDSEVPVKLRNNIAQTYASLAGACDALGTPVTKAAACRAEKHLRARKKKLTVREINALNADIKTRMEDEIGQAHFYTLKPGAAAFYKSDTPLFGSHVEARISEASDDISEGGKCFAVGRYTACAFHLMRAMEAAVKTLSIELGIPNVEREWGKLLSDIAKQIEPMPKGDKRDAWSAVHANLYHVKQAWRNSTMHPKKTYTEEEAKEVFDAMKAFMRQLAELMPPSAEELIG